MIATPIRQIRPRRPTVANRYRPLPFVLAMLAACSEPVTKPARPVTPEAFSQYFRAIDSTTVMQSPTSLISRVSEFTADDRGQFYIPDGSEGNVKVVAPDGRIIRMIGRKGGGPGEFARPGVTRFDARTNSLYVLDMMTSRIQVFDDTGGVMRQTMPKRAAPIASLEVLPSVTYLISQEIAREASVLHEVDSSGTILHSFLPIGGRFPPNVPKRPDWNSLRAHFFARRGDSLFVVSTLSDSMWTVSLADRTVLSAEALPVPSYSPPQDLPLKSGLRGPSLVVAWARSFHRASRIVATKSSLFVMFTKGAVLQGDSTVTMMRDGQGRWHAFTDAPVLLGARDSVLYATRDIIGDTLRVVTFAARTPL